MHIFDAIRILIEAFSFQAVRERCEYNEEGLLFC